MGTGQVRNLAGEDYGVVERKVNGAEFVGNMVHRIENVLQDI